MPYRSTDRTRQKKDAKRTAIMQAAVQVFADKGYLAATVRDIVSQAGVAVGTFYFYFPDKETLFLYLYEETADFLLQAVRQAVNTRRGLPRQVAAGIQAYLNIALYQPAIIQLLLLGGVGAVPALAERRAIFRQQVTAVWLRALNEAREQGQLPEQNTRRAAEALTGALDEVILNVLAQPDPGREAQNLVADMTLFALRAVAYPVSDGAQ